MTDVRIELARPDQAFVVGGLVIAADREDGTAQRAGFLQEYADAWIADHERRPTWLAVQPDGNPIGLVQAALHRKLPSLRRPATAWVHVGLVYVRPECRGRGLAEAMLREMLAWGQRHGVESFQLHTVPAARSLYERVGFGPAPERLMTFRPPGEEA